MAAHSSEARAGGDKRDRILEAAELVFARVGFFAARVADIAKEAQVADGTIYLYFKSKDDLLICLFESRMDRVNQSLSRAVGGEATAVAKLGAFVRTYLAMVKEQPAVAEVLTVELRQSSKFMKDNANPRFAEFLRLLAGIIAEGQSAGELNATIPAPMAARMIFGILDELALAWLLGAEHGDASASPRGRKFDIVRAADWVGALVTQGLEPRSRP